MKREWMQKAMTDKGMDVPALAMAAQVSPGLIELMLADAANVTHPRIALRVVKILGGGVKEFNGMVHEKHRCDELPKRIKRGVTADEA